MHCNKITHCTLGNSFSTQDIQVSLLTEHKVDFETLYSLRPCHDVGGYITLLSVNENFSLFSYVIQLHT
jgi:hypothetical protein